MRFIFYPHSQSNMDLFPGSSDTHHSEHRVGRKLSVTYDKV